MRSIFAAITVFALTAGAAAAASDAPADEYFGPFKYSAISVRTKIDALARSYNERWTDDASLVHDAQMIESSYRAWAQRYPKDRWLAPTAFHLAQLYQLVQTQDSRAHALAMYQFVAKAFPASKEAHLARLRLRQGLPPIHAESPVSPTPNPYASAAPSAGPTESTAPAASASGAPVSAPATAVPAPASAAPVPANAPPSTPSAAASAKPSASPKPASSPRP